MAIFNEEFIKKYNIDFLNEVSNSDVISDSEKQLHRFFHHMLKWKFQTTHQGSSWTNTISSSVRNLYQDINIRTGRKNSIIKKFIEDSIEPIYRYELCHTNQAINNIKLAKYKLAPPLDDNNELINIFNTFENIMNFDLIVSWLYKYLNDDGFHKERRQAIENMNTDITSIKDLDYE